MEDILGAEVRKSGAERVMDPRAATSFPLFSTMDPARHWPQGTGVGATRHCRKNRHHEQPARCLVLGLQPDLITTTWVGDDYGPLGRREPGGTSATDLDRLHARGFASTRPTPPMPPGIVRLRVDRAPDCG